MCETAQEQVIELSGELNALRSESDTASKFYCSQVNQIFLRQKYWLCDFVSNILTLSSISGKRGNSLFAEVDDQRQKMKALLIAQKANYIEVSQLPGKYLL